METPKLYELIDDHDCKLDEKCTLRGEAIKELSALKARIKELEGEKKDYTNICPEHSAGHKCFMDSLDIRCMKNPCTIFFGANRPPKPDIKA